MKQLVIPKMRNDWDRIIAELQRDFDKAASPDSRTENLCEIASIYSYIGDFQRSLHTLQKAEALLVKTSVDGVQQLTYAYEIACVLFLLGQCSEAETVATTNIDLLKRKRLLYSDCVKGILPGLFLTFLGAATVESGPLNVGLAWVKRCQERARPTNVWQYFLGDAVVGRMNMDEVVRNNTNIILSGPPWRINTALRLLERNKCVMRFYMGVHYLREQNIQRCLEIWRPMLFEPPEDQVIYCWEWHMARSVWNANHGILTTA